MPNYNMNDIRLRGTKGTIKEFLKAYIDERNEFDFDLVIPKPNSKEECPAKYICNPAERHLQPDPIRPWFDWYQWEYDYHGCKWNAWDTYYSDPDKAFPDLTDDEEIELVISFTTAWCPPMPVLEKICELWHDRLSIVCFYIEEGVGFCGTYDYVNGDICYDGGSDNPDFRQCTIDNGYYDQDYWDEYDADHEEDEEND